MNSVSLLICFIVLVFIILYVLRTMTDRTSLRVLVGCACISLVVVVVEYYKNWRKEYEGKVGDYMVPKPYGESGSVGTVYFFVADWCSHCSAAKPVITEFCAKYSQSTNNRIGGQYTIRTKIVDCTTSFDSDKYSLHNVKGYPAVRFVGGNSSSPSEFPPSEKMTIANLEAFCVKEISNSAA